MSVIQKFLENFPYVDLNLLNELSNEIILNKPDLEFVSRFIQNILDKKYVNDPIKLLKAIPKVILPENEEDKALVLFVYLHPIIGLLIAPVVLRDYAPDDFFKEFKHIAKHVYLETHEVICWAIENLTKMNNYEKQRRETLLFFSMAIAILSKELVILASSENEEQICLKLLECGLRAAEAINDKQSIIRIIESKAYLHRIMNDLENALTEYKKVVQILDDKKDMGDLQRVYMGLIITLLEMNRGAEAIPYIEKLMVIMNKLRRIGYASKEDISILNLYLGKALLQKGELKKAEKVLNNALKDTGNFNLELKRKIIDALINIYEALGDNKKAKKLREELKNSQSLDITNRLFYN